MQLQAKRVIIVGLGRSGVAAARLCVAHGAEVIGTDARPRSTLSEAAQSLPVMLVTGGHAGIAFESADVVVVSPGVPPMPELDRAARAGAEVIGELELAARFCKGPIIAIGGTNGKSTVTTLLASMFERDSRRVFSGGNLGLPLSEAVFSTWDVLVVEVSSFQLERAPRFHPRVAILLNISQDHLDRYLSTDDYANAKGNMFLSQTASDHAIVPINDRLCEMQAQRGSAKIITFGDGGNYTVQARSIIESASGETFDFVCAAYLGYTMLATWPPALRRREQWVCPNQR